MSLRRAIAVTSVAAICLAGWSAPARPLVPAAPAAGSASIETRATLGRFVARRALAHVRHLSGRIGVRVRATEAELRGQRYVKRRLRALGYRVFVQRFGVDGGTSRNVVATWSGARRYPVVIGAHVDTVAGSPGANDNASGVAVMLEVARLVAGRPQARWVKFVSFGSEEYGANGRHHLGSEEFVTRLGARGRRRLAGMVSVDMVADGRPLIVGTAGIGPRIVSNSFLHRTRKRGIRAVYRTTCDCSDNGPFELAGIPAAFIWSGSEPDYHSPSDVPANLSTRDLWRSGRAVRAFVEALDRKTIRHFRRRG
jgi:aminopeptidase YwaD